MSLKPWQINKPLTNPVDLTPALSVNAAPISPAMNLPTVSQPTSTMPTSAPVNLAMSGQTHALPTDNTLSTTNATSSVGMSSLTSPYNNSYSNYGGMGSYGGYGGMSSFGGMGMGMGMMGLGGFGLGMGMGMSTMSPDSFVFKSLRFMESASFLVSNVSQVSRSVEGHADGIHNLFSSIIGLFRRIKDWITKGLIKAKNAIIWLVNKLLVLLRIKRQIETEPVESTEGLTEEEIELRKLKQREQLLSIIIQVLLVVIVGMLILANLRRGRTSPSTVTSSDGQKALSELENVFKAHNM